MRLLKPLMFCLFMLSACTHKVNDHLPHDKMEDVLLDVVIAESASALPQTNRNAMGTKNWDTLAVYYAAIMSKHNVTPEEFTKSMDWYRNNQAELDTVLGHVITKADAVLNEQQTIR